MVARRAHNPKVVGSSPASATRSLGLSAGVFFLSHMAFTHVLYSSSLDRFYIGCTNDVHARLIRHNAGYEKYTRKGRPWSLVWTTKKNLKGNAMVLERKLKKSKSGKINLPFKKTPARTNLRQ